jgi:3-deoxy-7-phosphoheptulonate synthase
MMQISKNQIEEVARKHALTRQESEQIAKQREDIKRIITREDPRLMIVAGGCSWSDTESDKEFVSKYSEFTRNNQYPNHPLFYIARGYGEKPRSTFGWQGMIKEPIVNGIAKPDLATGINQYLEIAKYATQKNVPIASEIIEKFDIIREQIDPFLSIGFLGARNCADTTLRAILASKDFAIGAKHTQNSLKSGIEALISINHGDKLALLTENYQGYSKKNPYVAMVLRGFNNGPNYDANSLLEAIDLLDKAKQENQIEHGSIIVDCSHANSYKKAQNQVNVVNSLLESMENPRIKDNLSGIMLEANLMPWKQSISPDMTSGISVTDECIGFDELKYIINDTILPRYYITETDIKKAS